MEPPTEQELRAKLYNTLLQAKGFTEEDLAFLRCNVRLVQYYDDRMQAVAQIRVLVELLDSIQRFDEASAGLIRTTNRLTERIVCLTWVLLGIGVLGAVASGWPSLVWWVSHGFRLS